jgi:hypothetical protein
MVGWEAAMTTEELHAAMTAGFERVASQVAGVRADMKTEVATLRDEIATLRGEMKTETATLRGEAATLRAEIRTEGETTRRHFDVMVEGMKVDHERRIQAIERRR